MAKPVDRIRRAALQTDKLFEISRCEVSMMSTLALMAGFASHRRHKFQSLAYLPRISGPGYSRTGLLSQATNRVRSATLFEGANCITVRAVQKASGRITSLLFLGLRSFLFRGSFAFVFAGRARRFPSLLWWDLARRGAGRFPVGIYILEFSASDFPFF